MYIDELGESTPKRYKSSSHFILTGCVIRDEHKNSLMANLDHIKFKYWNSTDVIFHSTLIGKKEKEFSIFANNNSIFNEFIKNLDQFFNGCQIFLLCVAIDQHYTYTKNWKQKAVIKRAYREIIENYIRVLVAKNEKGQIVQEASTPIQDITIYEQFFDYQSKGIPEDGVTSADVKNHLTGVSFLTKRNIDTVSQVSDLLAYGIKMEVLHIKNGKRVSSMNPYQKMIRGKAKSKLFYYSPSTSTKNPKTKLYGKIDPLKIIP